MSLKKRTLDEMISYFNQEVSEMDIKHEYKMKLLGMITAIGYEAERKPGRWIEISSLHHTYKCSECGRLLVNITDGKNNVVKHYPYCHCGAKMEVEHD